MSIKCIDKQMFETTFSKYWDRLYSYCYKMTLDDEISQNIVQNVFVDLWEKRKKTEIYNIENYLFRAIKFQIFNYYRDRKFKREDLQNQFDEYIEENIETIDQTLLDKLKTALNELPERRGEIIHMNKIQNMSVEEIATELNLSKQTVKNQLHIAFKQIKEAMNKAALNILW